MRILIRQIRALLHILHEVQVKAGEIAEVLHPLNSDALNLCLRATAAVHADNTDWRNDGLTGSAWSVCPSMMRDDKSYHFRAGDVGKHVMENQPQEVLESEIYMGDHIPAR
jgi:hypothetical protein